MPALGRGGAGNIIQTPHSSSNPSTSTQNNISADLEANQQAAETSLVDDYEYRSEQQTYAHKGRGGAGNYYSPKELARSGTFAGAGTSHVLGDGTPAPAGSVPGDAAAAAASSTGGAGDGVAGSGSGSGSGSGGGKIEKLVASLGGTVGTASAPAYRGRGGAGNYSFGVTEAEEKAARKKEEDEKERLRVQIERGVEEGLARPEKAKIPGGEPY